MKRKFRNSRLCAFALSFISMIAISSVHAAPAPGGGNGMGLGNGMGNGMGVGAPGAGGGGRTPGPPAW